MLSKYKKILPLQLEIIPLALMIAAIYLTAANYASLPDIIPSHFNTQGIVDGYDNKNSILTFAGFSVFIFLLFSIISAAMATAKNPLSMMNLPFKQKITKDPESVEIMRISMIRMLFVLKIVLMGMMLYMLYGTIGIASGNMQSLGNWLWIFAAAILSIAAYMVYKSYRVSTNIKTNPDQFR